MFSIVVQTESNSPLIISKNPYEAVNLFKVMCGFYFLQHTKEKQINILLKNFLISAITQFNLLS
jgi:hypothetical protein